jgi:hypothetical protein
MDHVQFNAVNVMVIGLSASAFIIGGIYLVIWFAGMNVPVLTPIAKTLASVVHKIP